MSISKPLRWYEDSLSKLSKIILLGETDSIKYQANTKFKNLFKEALEQPGAFEYPFDSLVTIANLEAPDKKFRIFNWHIRKSNVTFEYFGLILYHNESRDKYYVTDLKDKSESIVRPEYARNLDENNWYGCHYYTIVGKKKKNNFYALIGWDGNYYNMQRKIIETVKFNSKGEPKFGGAKLKTPRGTKERFFIQYSSLVSATLNYNPKMKMIMFDHCMPDHPVEIGRYERYKPTGVFDAFTFKNNKWYFEHDIDARAPIKNKKPSQRDLRRDERRRYDRENR